MYRARTPHRPAAVEDVRSIVARASRVRVLGTRHAFNDPRGAFRKDWLARHVLP